MQRLFSGFADGLPGTGLLLLRLLTGAALIYFGIANLTEASPLPKDLLQMVGMGTGILLLVGLWTPAAAALAAIVKVFLVFSRTSSDPGDPLILFLQVGLSAVVAMVGPGAWSIDARLYGRRRINIPER